MPAHILAFRQRPVPSWYQLELDGCDLVFRMPRAIWEEVAPQLKPGRLHGQATPPLPAFKPPTKPVWGYHQSALTVQGADETRVTIQCPHHLLDHHEQNWARGVATSATIDVLAQALLNVEQPSPWTAGQDVVIKNIGVGGGPSCAGAANVMVGWPVIEWLARHDGSWLRTPVIEAMRRVFSLATGPQAGESSKFNCLTGPAGRLVLVCPGDACGLSPGFEDTTRPYELYIDNGDNPWQQYTLLAGLATLLMAVRSADAP